jgi:hypothetical protein
VCYPLKTERQGQQQANHGMKLIQQAQDLWQTLQSIGEKKDNGENEFLSHDMSLAQFVHEQLGGDTDNLSNDDLAKIELILECMFSNTAASCNEFLGIHEASREEWNWEFTESNFRSEQCFAEFIQYYLDRIDQINKQGPPVKITIQTSSPIVEIRSCRQRNQRSDSAPGPQIQLETNAKKRIICDKCIVTVPLAVLKAKTIRFLDDFAMPADMQLAIDTIQMFSGMKAHMLLRIGEDVTHCPEILKFTELFFCPGEIFSQVWLRRNETTVFLTGFCVANCRDRLLGLVSKYGCNYSKTKVAEDQMLQQVQRIIASGGGEQSIFVKPGLPKCSCFALHDWSDDEYVMGAYSSPSIDAGWQFTNNKKSCVDALGGHTHRDYLARPIKDAIWLAGEHANVKTCATVQSAMESGARAAKEVFQTLL